MEIRFWMIQYQAIKMKWSALGYILLFWAPLCCRFPETLSEENNLLQMLRKPRLLIYRDNEQKEEIAPKMEKLGRQFQ